MAHEIKVKGMSWTITMQGFKLAAITDAEKTKLRRKKPNFDLKKITKSTDCEI